MPISFLLVAGTLNNNFLSMFGETPSFHAMIRNDPSATTIKNWLFGVHMMIFPPLQSSDKWMFRFPLKIPGRTGSPQRERVEFDLPSKKPPGEKTKHEFSVDVWLQTSCSGSIYVM